MVHKSILKLYLNKNGMTDNLVLRKSSRGGLGIFAVVPVKKGFDFPYGGKLQKTQSNADAYVAKVLDGIFVSAKKLKTRGPGAMVNSVNENEAAEVVNAEIVWSDHYEPYLFDFLNDKNNGLDFRLMVKAKRDINPGEEILVDYGPDYWSTTDT